MALIAEFDSPDLVNLQGWHFPKNETSGAAFQSRIFKLPVVLKEAVFEDDISFDSTQFLEGIDFEGAHFEGEADFSGTRFGDETATTGAAKFDKATFMKPVTFAGAKFFSQSSFKGTVLENDFNMNDETDFRAYAYFHGAAFKGEAMFNGVQFTDVTEFDGANFQRGASFVDTKFFGQTTFNKAVFLELVDFSGAEFRNLSKFEQAHFQRRVTFQGAKFRSGGDANFDRAIFHGTVSFKKTEFHRPTYFTETNFAREAAFEGTEFHANANFVNTIFQDVSFISAKFENAGASKTVTKFEGVQFGRGTFSATTFCGEFVFDYPRFAGLTVFERTVFCGGAKFHVQVDERNRLSIRQTDLSGAEFSKSLIENIDFEDVEWQSSEPYRLKIADEPDIKEFSRLGNDLKRQLAEARRLYRQLRLNYDKSGDYETAGRFYVSESEMSYRLLPRVVRWIHPRGLYKWASKYGESLSQATFWLIGLVFLFTLLYWITSQFHPIWFTEPPKMLGTEHLRKLSFLDALWFSLQASKPIADLGLYPGTIFYWLALAEGIIVPTQIALFLLAIRRRFRRGD